MNALLRATTILASAAIMLILQASCARSVSSEVDSNPLLSNAKPDPLTVCVATECPAPWATCSADGLCATDTRRDVQNCGACGVACVQPKSHHATAVCANGKCAFACDELSADCNHKDFDGCEVFTGDDPDNCGGCGNACKTGDGGADAREICWKGACGCPNGFTACGKECKNLESDSLNCGSCGKKCVPPPSNDPEWTCGPNIQPPDTTWGCATGKCKLTCKALFGDCNANLCSDGCEVDERTDPLNCGACGHKCDAGQGCVDGTCICPPGTTRCGNACVDLNVDPDHCGSCDNGCPGASDDTANGGPTCAGGRCGYLCYAGFADCNHRLNDGCEVNIGSDPLHCGSCSTQCDRGRSQPCVLGQCLTKPCTPGPGTQ